MTHALPLVRELLSAVANGDATDALVELLVQAVLDTETVRLALEIASGGQNKWRRAIDLAGLIIANERVKMVATK